MFIFRLNFTGPVFGLTIFINKASPLPIHDRAEFAPLPAGSSPPYQTSPFMSNTPRPASVKLFASVWQGSSLTRGEVECHLSLCLNTANGALSEMRYSRVLVGFWSSTRAVMSLGAGATSNDGWRQGRSAASRVIHVYTGVRDTFFAWRYNIGDMQICCRLASNCQRLCAYNSWT